MSRPQAAVPARWWLWLPMLAISLWLALFGDRSPASSTAEAVSERASIAAPGGAAQPQPQAVNDDSDTGIVALVPRERLVPASPRKASGRDLFSARSWAPPPAPPPPAMVARPTAPPLPYTYLGKKQEAGAWEVYLGKGDRALIAREGLVLEGIYRVDRIAPPTLSLTYLPLEQAQTLGIGELH